jgi:neutral ceramidase
MHPLRQFVTCCLPILLTTAAMAQDQLWKAGIASEVVTPNRPMWMAGYASRNRPSEGATHDLFVKALALQSADGTRMVFVTSDLISVPRPIRDTLEKQVAEKFGLSPEELMINCSHTHCGPEIRTTRWSLDGLPSERLQLATEYVEFLQRTLLKVVGDALAHAIPSKVSYCRARCGFAMNRRTPTPTGFRNFPNPDGPVDHDVPVLRIDTPEGKLRAVMFGYACHNTTLGFYNFCGDYAGFAQQYLEDAHPGVTALFVLGCGGDQNPYPRRTLPLAEQHGRSLSNAVETALETNAKTLPARIKSAFDMVTVEYQPSPSREALLQRAKSSNKYDRIHAERLLKQLDTEGRLRQQYDCPVQVIRFGEDLTLIALPGETVVDYSLRLKNELSTGDGSGPSVWVAGYSNDVFAYVPSRRVLLEGGYEAGGAMRYMTTVLQHGPFTPTVEERIVSKVHELNRKLASERVVH